MNRHIEISEQEVEAIEQYIRQELTVEERARFEQRLSNDPALQSKVDAISLLLVGVQEAHLTEKLNEFHSSMTTSASTQKLIKVKSIQRWLVAASVIVLAGIASWLLLTMQSREQKLFAKFYSPDPGLISAMSSSDDYQFDRAMLDYKRANYDSAIRVWQSMATVKPGNDTLNYFLGCAYLAKGEHKKALEKFKKVIAIQNSYFIKDAYWFAGLAMLQQGNKTEAISYIEKSEHDDKNMLLLELKK